jgi:hypothetical protein
LFNLRHSQARNAVERVFGILKRRFALLTRSPEFPYVTQTRIVPALCAIHNFIRIHDVEEIENFPEDLVDPSFNQQQSVSGMEWQPASRAEQTRGKELRDEIALAMWESYQDELRRRRMI